MIRIVKGTYGYLDKNGIVKPRTANDAPFTLTPQKEERLVKKGVAVYVGEVAEPAGSVAPAAWDAGMKADELRAIARDMGLTFPVGTTKAAMVEAMDKHMAEADSDAGGGNEEDEAAPVFDATEAVD